MRWLVWLLLLVNAMLLGYFQLAVPRHVAAPVALDLHAAKIKIVSAEELAAKAKPDTSALSSPQSVAPPSVCYEWGSFAAQDAARAKEALDRLALAVTAQKHTPQETIRYWVYIPPLKTPEAAQAKAAEVRQLGIEEIFIIQEPKWRNAISLGVFRDEGLANKYLEELRNRGVKSAVKSQRNHDGEQTGYLISNMTPAQLEEINKLKAEYFGSDLKQVECK